MARECRKMWGDIDLPSKLGAIDLAPAAARRTTCVTPKRVRRSPWAPRTRSRGMGTTRSRRPLP